VNKLERTLIVASASVLLIGPTTSGHIEYTSTRISSVSLQKWQNQHGFSSKGQRAMSMGRGVLQVVLSVSWNTAGMHW